MENCDMHSAHEVRLTALERSDQRQWERIDAMKNWVIAGMGGLLVQAVLFIATIVMKGH